MYGLFKAGMLANNQLTKHFSTYGYSLTAHTPGLLRHQTRPISFTLVVDNFGVKYVGRQHSKHLVAALVAPYPLTIDWEGKLYCGLTLNWDYNAHTFYFTMHGYIPEALHKFKHPTGQLPQHSPHH